MADALTKTIDTARQDDGYNSWTYNSRVSFEHRYLCMTVPKVACTTVKRTLHLFEGVPPAPDWGEIHDQGPDLRLSTLSSAEIAAILADPDWLRFAFVRNPYDRMLAAWKQKIANPWDTQYAWLRDQIRVTTGYSDRGGEAPPIVAFGDFVRFVVESEDPRVILDGHWDLQTNVLLFSVIPYDVIGRFERFVEDFVSVLQRLDAPFKVLEMARTVTNATPYVPWAAAFDRPIADLIYEKYERDFTAFGYERNSWMSRDVAPFG